MEDGTFRTDPLESKAPESSPHSSSQTLVSRRAFAGFAGSVAMASCFAAPFGEALRGCELDVSSRAAPKISEDAVKSAQSDYARNCREWGGRLASPPEKLAQARPTQSPWAFDVLIVGSGYGASVCAARLSRHLKSGKRLGVLERGPEWTPYDLYLSRRGGADSEGDRSIVPIADRPYSFCKTEFGSIVHAIGLGGASLIDSGEADRIDPSLLQNANWPTAFRDPTLLGTYYERAEKMLGSQAWRGDCSEEAQRLQEVSVRLQARGATFSRPNVAFVQSRVATKLPVMNAHGVLQGSCVGCGDCWRGCPLNAKGALSANYLMMARRAGAEFFVRTEVHSIEKVVDYYRVHYTQWIPDKQGKLTSVPGCVTARMVILGAGSLGSTEILLKSSSRYFCFSPALGSGWNSNGTILGAIRKTQSENLDLSPVYSTKSSTQFAHNNAGPLVQVNLKYGTTSSSRVAIQFLAGNMSSLRDLIREGTQVENGKDIQWVIASTEEQQRGRIVLGDDSEVRIHGFRSNTHRELIQRELSKLAETMGSKMVHLPSHQELLLHSLGGCCMSDSPKDGVVNHRGEVFDTIFGGFGEDNLKKERVHKGLFVCDGSILPTALGCGPSLTIAAIAERTSEWILSDSTYQDLFELP